MSPCSPTGLLREEHRLILRVVDALDATLSATPPGRSLDLDLVDDCVTFFRLFTDACHHGKEEDLLFEELVREGFPREQGPVAVMLEEHRMGRALVRRMEAGAEAARGGDAAARPGLRSAAADYVRLLRQHIAKEDGVLFEMADGRIGEERCARLCDAYADVCARRFEGLRHADLLALAERIAARGDAAGT